MKVGILTFTNGMNYGQRLQNYALQTQLELAGHKIYTIRQDHKHSLKHQLKLWAKSFLGHPEKESTPLFYEFNSQYVSFYEKILSETKDNSWIDGEFDKFIAGSDQVWNPKSPYVNSNFFLQFAQPQKRISYAASFSVNEIPAAQIETYKNWLRGIPYISVREHRAVEIVNELIGRKPELVLDPTLLLNAQQWINIERCPNCIPSKPYIVIYALGAKNQQFLETIECLKNNHDYEIIDISPLALPQLRADIGPLEFIYLIHHAQAILTDSFHGATFSLIFHKRVTVFKRTGLDMNSRLYSLSEIIGLGQNDDHISEGIVFLTDEKTNFETIEKNLGNARKRSIHFLNNSLEN